MGNRHLSSVQNIVANQLTARAPASQNQIYVTDGAVFAFHVTQPTAYNH